MIGLTDIQLQTIVAAATTISEPERRSLFLERTFAMLKLKRRFTDADVVEGAKAALTGLVQGRTVAA